MAAFALLGLVTLYGHAFESPAPNTGRAAGVSHRSQCVFSWTVPVYLRTTNSVPPWEKRPRPYSLMVGMCSFESRTSVILSGSYTLPSQLSGHTLLFHDCTVADPIRMLSLVLFFFLRFDVCILRER